MVFLEKRGVGHFIADRDNWGAGVVFLEKGDMRHFIAARETGVQGWYS